MASSEVCLIISTVISVLTLLGLGTVAKLFWEDRHKKKLEESKENKERLKKERHKEITDAVSEIVNPLKADLKERIDKINNRLTLSEKCDQAGLRNSLLNCYYSCKEKGYRTEDDSKNYREMHEAYNAIGGNSFIDSDVSRWFDNLPLKPNDYAYKKARKTAKNKKEDK